MLNLRNTGQNFWSLWSGDMDHGSSSSLMAPVSEGSLRKGRPLAPLEVFIELCLKERTMDEFLTYLIRWIADRKDSIHLCCKKLMIESIPFKNIMKFLHLMPLDSLQEVQVNCIWQLSTLSLFAPLLGQMRSVQRLILSPILVCLPLRSRSSKLSNLPLSSSSCTTSGISLWNVPPSSVAVWTRCSGETGTTD